MFCYKKIVLDKIWEFVKEVRLYDLEGLIYEFVFLIDGVIVVVLIICDLDVVIYV